MRASKMGFTKYGIKKFDWSGDYGLWKQKMYALLVQQDISEGISEGPEYQGNYLALSKKKLLENAYTIIILKSKQRNYNS